MMGRSRPLSRIRKLDCSSPLTKIPRLSATLNSTLTNSAVERMAGCVCCGASCARLAHGAKQKSKTAATKKVGWLRICRGLLLKVRIEVHAVCVFPPTTDGKAEVAGEHIALDKFGPVHWRGRSALCLLGSRHLLPVIRDHFVPWNPREVRAAHAREFFWQHRAHAREFWVCRNSSGFCIFALHRFTQCRFALRCEQHAGRHCNVVETAALLSGDRVLIRVRHVEESGGSGRVLRSDHGRANRAQYPQHILLLLDRDGERS